MANFFRFSIAFDKGGGGKHQMQSIAFEKTVTTLGLVPKKTSNACKQLKWSITLLLERYKLCDDL